ncbi:hypothetical protein BOTBODRAFT_29046 [Botryobasidium botryosum FD-172 SS1]|uniref:Uncharacterized protein n=1 Tax=Botryobasidium botryosum (strain FD-172 SS1) TaxID=930990 RepID=A0A067N4F8_BOTB1|nr:hypothetical protein BOTBODRAFT_29046 [Botryobasidium botryosum FD-172 SS1]
MVHVRPRQKSSQHLSAASSPSQNSAIAAPLAVTNGLKKQLGMETALSTTSFAHRGRLDSRTRRISQRGRKSPTWQRNLSVRGEK